ncbi:MAG: hypothetical protein Q4C70_04500, partial [Planctomycetia bacterium]|nr:hypothetical protein [Planctomycetia bacterium]
MPGMVPEMDPNTAALRGVSGFQPQPEITSVQQLGMPQPGIMPGMVPEMDPNTAALRGVSGFQPQPEITSVQQLGMSQQQVQPEPISQPENGLDFGATGFGTTSTSARTTTSPTARRKNTGGKSTSKTSARGKDNTPIVIGSVAGVILILIALGIYSGNTDTARAKKLYIEAQSAVNELNFDRGRELMDCALELETTVEYENYRKSIDIKQKKYEKRLRHEAARQADDFDI